MTLPPLTLAVRHALACEQGGAGQPPDLSGADPATFEAAVARQRLAVMLGPHLTGTGLPDESIARIVARGSAERLLALMCAARTVEAVSTLEAARVRVMVVKGVALAQQSTGDLAARGAGDIDLWVHPDDVPAAARALGAVGYGPTAQLRAQAARSRYRSWAAFEASLARPAAQGVDVIDLHWRLRLGTRPLPGFDEAWQHRSSVVLGGRDVATLGVADAAVHTCVHGSADGWRWQRSIVDVHRLLALVPPAQRAEVGTQRSVRTAAAVAYDLTGGEHLLAFAAEGRGAARQRRTAAEQQQRAGWTSAGELRAGATWGWLRQQASLSSSPQDAARLAASWLLPPALLVDADTGDAIPLRAAARARIAGVAARVTRG